MILLKCQQQPGLKNFTTKKKKTTLHKYNGMARVEFNSRADSTFITFVF